MQFKNYEIGQVSIADNVEKIRPLHVAHYQETETKYKHHTVNVNYDHMIACEARGTMFLFGARTVDTQELIAYLFMYLNPSAHDDSMVATADAFFILPEHRSTGVARRLLQFTEASLKDLGANYMFLTDKSPLGGPHLKMFFESEGYAQTAIAYSKVL